MCWNRALLVHHTCSQCVPARRVRALRIARKHARGEILCRRLEWEQGAVSSRVASLLRSAEAKPMFYRFVRSSGPSPCTAQWRCVLSGTRPLRPRPAPPARPKAHAAARRRLARPPAADLSLDDTNTLHSPPRALARARALGPPPQWRCVSYPLPATCPEYPNCQVPRVPPGAGAAPPAHHHTPPLLPPTRTSHHLRPQNHENTVSRPICEVKHGIV